MLGGPYSLNQGLSEPVAEAATIDALKARVGISFNRFTPGDDGLELLLDHKWPRQHQCATMAIILDTEEKRAVARLYSNDCPAPRWVAL